MPSLKTYNLFISHAWDYHSEYDSLVRLLNGTSNLSWRNYSVPNHDPLHVQTATELEKALRTQITFTHAVLILAGMYCDYRRWIQKEIDIAQAMGKPMIGVIPRGNERTPSEVSSVVKTIVAWNTDSIVTAIRTYAL